MDFFRLQIKKHRLYILLNPALRLVFPYAMVGFVIAGSTLLMILFRAGLNTSTVALLFLLPVLFSTTIWGLGPGIMAALLAFLSYNFFFLTPYYTLTVHESQDLIALVIFLVVAILISQLVGRVKLNLEASLKREKESNRLYELSVGLAGVNDLKEIAAIVAQKILETFPAKAVSVSVESLLGEKAFSVEQGERTIENQGKPTAVAPLETVRGFLGEIRLWHGSSPLSSAEMRLLQTFAAQAALALERAALAHVETRARVLEESDRLKSALLSSVSHEFRTPLATIKASITSLFSRQVDWDSQARQELLEAVDEEAENLDHLVGNLLDMSKIEAGALHPIRQWNWLAEIVDGVVARMHRVLRDHHMRVDILGNLPLIPLDYIQIERVLTNLLSNSAKYAPPGSEIILRARLPDSDTLLVQVINQGPPVAHEHLSRIFDKFYRVTNAEKVSGTGLGLSICKGIIEAHGGKIWAENLPEGLTFSFSLPLTMDGARPAAVNSEEE